MMQLYVVPADVHERVMSVSRGCYNSLEKAEDLKKIFSLEDIASIATAFRRFPFRFESTIDIIMGRSPFEVISSAEPDSLYTRRLKAELETRSDEPKLVSVYALYPVDNDTWVAVEQRVHNEKGYLQRTVIESNQEFISALLASVNFLVPFEELAKTELFTNYLTATHK